MQLTPRDRQILAAVYQHRYLSSQHVHALLFAGRHVTLARLRLRKLWQHRYLDRFFFPVVLDGTRDCLRNAARPLYCLSRHGAQVVAADAGLDVEHIPHTSAQNAEGYATLQHHLVTTDLLVALQGACGSRTDVEVVSFEREHALWGSVNVARARTGLGTYIVPDGAFTLRREHTPRPWTFYVEIVRADARSGNKSLLKKMRQYVQLLRAGFFKAVYGHESVRAVLFCTTTSARADNFRQLSSRLPHGKNLFWFTAYEAFKTQGIPMTTFTPETILTSIFTDAQGAPHALVPPTPPPII